MLLRFYLLTIVLCIGMPHFNDQSRYMSRTLRNSNQHLEIEGNKNWYAAQQSTYHNITWHNIAWHDIILHYITSSHCSTVSAVLGTRYKGESTECNVPMDAISVTHAFEIVKSHFDQIIPTSIKMHVSKCMCMWKCAHKCVPMFMIMKNSQTIFIIW